VTFYLFVKAIAGNQDTASSTEVFMDFPSALLSSPEVLFAVNMSTFDMLDEIVSVEGGNVVFTLGDLAPGEEIFIQFTMDIIGPGARGELFRYFSVVHV
jgi:hypothetical protein